MPTRPGGRGERAARRALASLPSTTTLSGFPLVEFVVVQHGAAPLTASALLRGSAQRFSQQIEAIACPPTTLRSPAAIAPWLASFFIRRARTTLTQTAPGWQRTTLPVPSTLRLAPFVSSTLTTLLLGTRNSSLCPLLPVTQTILSTSVLYSSGVGGRTSLTRRRLAVVRPAQMALPRLRRPLYLLVGCSYGRTLLNLS